MTRGKSARIPGIDGVAAQFQRWRRNKKGRAPIPDALWSAAVKVARRNGVNRTAGALHLDGGKLKRRMDSSQGTSNPAGIPAFMELVAPGAGQPLPESPEYTIELEGRRGKLRIHCKGTTAADLADLSRALWDVAS